MDIPRPSIPRISTTDPEGHRLLVNHDIERRRSSPSSVISTARRSDASSLEEGGYAATRQLAMEMHRINQIARPEIDISPKLWRIVWPYFQLGRFFGVAYLDDKHQPRKGLIAYCIFTFVMILFNNCRGLSFQSLDGFSAIMVFRFLLLLYAIHCMIAFYMLIKCQTEQLYYFMLAWKELHLDGEVPHYKTLIWCTNFGVIYVFGTTVANGLFVLLGSLGYVIHFPFIKPYLFLDDLMFMNGLIVLFTAVPFAMSQMLYCSMCLILYFELKYFNSQIAKAAELGTLAHGIGQARRQHGLLIALVDRADDLVSYYAFAVYCLNLPTLVMTAYMLVRTEMGIPSQITFTCWVGILMLQIGVVSIIPSMINSEAHSPQSLVEQSSVCQTYKNAKTTATFWKQTTLFIVQLTGRGIGISGGGFFIITKSLLLTIVSLTISYFTLLLQFDLGASYLCKCSCGFNSTMELPGVAEDL